MPTEFQCLRRAIVGAAPAGGYRWEELLADLWPALSSPVTPEGEHLLLEIVRFGGQLQIDPSSETPHSMAPEEMLKSLAIQGARKVDGPRASSRDAETAAHHTVIFSSISGG